MDSSNRYSLGVQERQNGELKRVTEMLLRMLATRMPRVGSPLRLS